MAGDVLSDIPLLINYFCQLLFNAYGISHVQSMDDLIPNSMQWAKTVHLY